MIDYCTTKKLRKCFRLSGKRQKDNTVRISDHGDCFKESKETARNIPRAK